MMTDRGDEEPEDGQDGQDALNESWKRLDQGLDRMMNLLAEVGEVLGRKEAGLAGA